MSSGACRSDDRSPRARSAQKAPEEAAAATARSAGARRLQASEHRAHRSQGSGIEGRRHATGRSRVDHRGVESRCVAVRGCPTSSDVGTPDASIKGEWNRTSSRRVGARRLQTSEHRPHRSQGSGIEGRRCAWVPDVFRRRNTGRIDHRGVVTGPRAAMLAPRVPTSEEVGHPRGPPKSHPPAKHQRKPPQRRPLKHAATAQTRGDR